MDRERPGLNRWLGWTVVAAALTTGCAQTSHWSHLPLNNAAKDRDLRFSFAQVSERDGNLYKAERTYRELHQEAPKDPRFTHRLGVVRVRQGELEEGLVLLEQAAQQREDDVEILNDLGYAYLISGDFSAAEREFQRALAIDARNSRTLNNLALAVGYAGRTQESYELFRRTGGEAEARSNVAYILAQCGDLPAAMREYNRALGNDPNYKPAAEALLQLAAMQRALQAGDDAGVQYAQRPPENVITPVRYREVARDTTTAGGETKSPEAPVGLIGEIEDEGRLPQPVDTDYE